MTTRSVVAGLVGWLLVSPGSAVLPARPVLPVPPVLRSTSLRSGLPTLATPTVLWAQDDVGVVADRIAAAWRGADADSLEVMFPATAVRLSLDATTYEGMSRRQARAALGRFLGGFEAGRVLVRRAESLGGEPPRGIVELEWTVRAPGTPEERSFVIFVSLERSDGDWCIREIRVFP